MKKLLSIILASAVCTTCMGQRAVKYKDIYSKIGQEPAEHSLLKLTEFQKLQPEFPNTYVQTALINWAWLQEGDPYLNYAYVQNLIYNTKLYLSLAIDKIGKDEKEVKKNKAYYTNLGLGANADELKQGDVLDELNRILGIVKNYEEKVTSIISNLNSTIEKYNECISIYNGIVARQSNYKNLLLTSSSDLRSEMNSLAQSYDSAMAYFSEFKKAQGQFRDYKLKLYNQQTKTIPIVTYRLEGLTSSNFINPEIPIWDYKTWVDEAFKEMDGNIAKLKNESEKEIKSLRTRVEKLQKAKAQTDSIQEIVAPNALVNLVEKYDYESLLSASLRYEAALANLKVSSMRSANNTSNMESFSENYFQKASYYYDLFLMAQEAKNTLETQSARITDNNCSMHEDIVNSLYGGKEAMQNGYKERQMAEIDKVMAQNLENFKLYTIDALAPEGVEDGGISAKPYTGKFADAPAAFVPLYTIKDNSGNRYVCGYQKTSDNNANGFISKFNSDEKLMWTKPLNAGPTGINKVVQIIPSAFAGFVAVATCSSQGECKTIAVKMDNNGNQTGKVEMQTKLHPAASCYDEIGDKITTAFKGASGNEDFQSDDEACIETATFGQPSSSASPAFRLKGQIADIVKAKDGYMAICNYTSISASGQEESAAADIAAVTINGSIISLSTLNAGKIAKAFKAFQVNAETVSITGAWDNIGSEMDAKQKPAYIILQADGKFAYHN